MVPNPELDFLRWVKFQWLIRRGGREGLKIVVLGRGLMLFEFEMVQEIEWVLTRGRRRVQDNFLCLEKWNPKVGYF